MRVVAWGRWLARRPLVLGLAGALLIAVQGWSLWSAARQANATQYKMVPISESFGLTPQQAKRARKVIAANNCLVCHRVGDVGGSAGPDLTNYAKRDIRADDLMVFLRKPTSWYPSTTMPAYPDLSNQELKLIANYVTGLVDAEQLRQLPPGTDLSGGVCGPRFVPMGDTNKSP